MQPEIITPVRYRLERTPTGVTLWFRSKDGREIGIDLHEIDIENITRELQARPDAIQRN